VGPGKDLLHITNRFGRILYCVQSTQYSLLVFVNNTFTAVHNKLCFRENGHMRVCSSAENVPVSTALCKMCIRRFRYVSTPAFSLDKRRMMPSFVTSKERAIFYCTQAMVLFLLQNIIILFTDTAMIKIN